MQALDVGFSSRTNFYVGVVVLLALGIGIGTVLGFFFWWLEQSGSKRTDTISFWFPEKEATRPE